MKIINNFNESIGTQAYLNDVYDALTSIEKVPTIKEVVFVNYPITEVNELLNIIQHQCKTGIIRFHSDGLSYIQKDVPLSVAVTVFPLADVVTIPVV